MTWLRLALANLGLSPLTSAVNIVLMGLGTASIVLLLLAGAQLSAALERNARGIDLVLGASGSPVQLVLAAVYHADVPPGNIRQQDAERWAADPRVEAAVPLSLGDSYRGFRIVGTTTAYLDLYGADRVEGRRWTAPMEAVVGSAVAEEAGLEVGSRFAGAHGFAAGGFSHAARPYRVVGILEPTGTIVDRLILTSLESVWALHGSEPQAPSMLGGERRTNLRSGERSRERRAAEGAPDARAAGSPATVEREITALLIRYRTPLAAMTLPREIAAGGRLQGASPALEIARILRLVGLGLDGLKAFSWVLILTAALSVFAALYGSLRARRGDLAMLRCLGASRWELLWALLLEALVLTMLGVALGFILGHGAMEFLGHWIESARGVALTGWDWLPSETFLLLGLFGVGTVAGIVPALQAYHTDVARTLAEG